MAPRPTITKSQPVFSYISLAETPSTISPFAITGILTESHTALMLERSTGGAYICALVLP